MKTKHVILGLLLATLTAQAQLRIDFSRTTTPIAAGWQGYTATHEVAASFTSQSYSAFGTTVSILPTWQQPSYPASMQMIDRGTNDGLPAGDVDLLRDWIGTDNRVTTGSAPTPGLNHMTLTITGLPVGTYRWLSYHHDPEDQTGLFDATVTDGEGSRTTTGIDISNGNNTLGLAAATKWITTITSDGVNPVRILFAGQAVSPNQLSFFVMNAFELSFLGVASKWTNATGGNWSDAANWGSPGVPNASDRIAIFGPSILAPSTVTVDMPVTLAALNLASDHSYTLAGANGMTLGATVGILIDKGSHTISAPLGVSGGGGLTISGLGELTLSGANSYVGPTIANNSVLTITSLANGGVLSPLGASSSDGANLIFNGVLHYIGSGHTSDRLFTLGVGAHTLEASGTGPLNLSNPGPLPISGTGARTLVLAGSNTGDNTLRAALTDSGSGANNTSLTKNGPGKWVLAGANTFTGNIAVNEGTLAVVTPASLGLPAVVTLQSNAVLDASVAGSLSTSFVLQGSGSVAGNVADGGLAIRPGGAGVMGTLVFSNSLTLASGGTLEFDLSSDTTVGGGTNDLIVVGGNLDLSFITVKVNFTGASLGSSYRLINYQGTLSGTLSVAVTGLETTRYQGSISTATPGQVNLLITGTPAALTWVGDGAGNVWNLQTSYAWTNPAIMGLDLFSHLDHVTFNNLGSAATNVNLDAILRPGSVTVSATADYYLGGTGRVSGATSLLKAGTGTLTISNANDFTGTTTIAGGTLKLASDTALGTSAGDTSIQSGATLDVNSFQTSSDHIYVAGSGVGGRGAIVNSSADEINAIRKLTLTADTLGNADFRWDVRGAGGNNSFSGLFDLGGFNFTKLGTNRVAIVDSLATNAGNIVVIQGALGLTRSTVEGPGYINIGTNLLWIENSTTGIVSKPLAFSGGRLQCSGNSFLLHSFITNEVGLTLDCGAALTITNPISGSGGLIKIGSSSARLEAANSYAGDTTISAGTLALGTNGTLGGGALITLATGATLDVISQSGFTVASGKTMVGSGTVNGGLTVAPGATLQVGSVTNTETLMVANGTGSLGGVTLMQLNSLTKTNDRISSTNAITCGGTLTVANLGATFANGDSFKLLDAPAINGAFSSVSLPPLGAGQIWINKLTVDGTISVANLVLGVTRLPGDFLQFSWPTQLDSLVKVQAQTNTLGVGLSNNWFDYPNGTFNGVLHLISTNNPCVFFRLSTQ